MKKRIALIVLAGIILIFSIVDYALSFSSYKDEWGYAGFSFSTDALILMLTAVVVLVITILYLYGYLKNKSYTREIEITTFTVVAFNAGYSLFTMLKIIGSAVSKLWKGKEFSLSYDDVSLYVIWSAVTIAFLIYLIFSYLEKNKKD